MLKLIQNATVYCPKFIGKKDILICDSKIAKIADHIPLPDSNFYEIEILDAANQLIVPGFIDLHVHLIGGGGEGGFTTRTPEIQLSQITTRGVTTVVGCLGTDGITRSLPSLLAKARALEFEGVHSFLWTGCYEYPTRTITNSCREDIVLIDKIIGVGEVAISDHRGSHPVKSDIERLALECRVGGLLSGKCGILHLHVGDDKEGLDLLLQTLDSMPVLSKNILPTHINRSATLLYQGIEYIKKGGYIDLTSGIYKTKEDSHSVDASYAFKYLLDHQCEASHITISSDSNGSMPVFNEDGKLDHIGVGSIESNFIEFKKMIQQYNIPIETALAPFTINPATLLQLENLGSIDVNQSADLLLLNSDLSIDYVICKGKTMVQHGKAVKFGTFEQA